jgi:dGTPase
MTTKAARVISELFEVFMNDPRLLPPEPAHHTQVLEEAQGTAGRARAVADYIAGMTDRYAIKEYNRLLDPLQLT